MCRVHPWNTHCNNVLYLEVLPPPSMVVYHRNAGVIFGECTATKSGTMLRYWTTSLTVLCQKKQNKKQKAQDAYLGDEECPLQFVHHSSFMTPLPLTYNTTRKTPTHHHHQLGPYPTPLNELKDQSPTIVFVN